MEALDTSEHYWNLYVFGTQQHWQFFGFSELLEPLERVGIVWK